MKQAFVIMQIGNDDMDGIYAKYIFPAITSCGLDAKRVDRHNRGGLLKSEIIQFIQDSDILIADITNERPNVYLEIGYAMGIDKFTHLILTVREDHFMDSPNHKANGPKVHFDLSGYDILRWHADALDEFKIELEKRIRRRMAIICFKEQSTESIIDAEWFTEHVSRAHAGLASMGKEGFLEVKSAIKGQYIFKPQKELNDAARTAMIRTSGWPFAVYIEQDGFRPKPRAGGIFAEIDSKEMDTYDYWSIHRNGDLYFLGSYYEDKELEEDKPSPKYFNFDQRIMRVAEVLIYLIRLYTSIGIDRSTEVRITIRHGGLKGRKLTAIGNRLMVRHPKSEENIIEGTAVGSIDYIENNLVTVVKSIISPVFLLFDFTEFDDSIYEDIINKFISGKIL